MVLLQVFLFGEGASSACRSSMSGAYIAASGPRSLFLRPRYLVARPISLLSVVSYGCSGLSRMNQKSLESDRGRRFEQQQRGASLAEAGAALARLDRSETFARSASLLRLLRFVMENADCQGDGPKETYIGTVFYGREGTYDPRYDSIVRVNVKRLRSRLIEYYEGEGKEDTERVVIPLGTYTAVLETLAVEVPEVLVEPVVMVTAPVVAPIPEVRRRRFQWKWVVALAACFALLIAGDLWLKRIYATPLFASRDLTSWPLTPGTDIETDATVSPDGNTLAYVTRKQGSEHFQIFLRPFQASDQVGTPLDTGTGDALRPAWSPDGRMLALLHCGIGPCEIETIPVSGGMPRSIRVLPRAVLRDDQPYFWTRQQRPLWTPDGKALIFPNRAQNDDREALVEHDLASGAETILTTGKKADEEGAVALSPDGRTIAFIRVNLDSAAIMTLDLATRRQKVIAAGWDVHTNGMAWSPDGRGVVLSRQHDARWQPWWVPLHGAARPLAVNLPVALNPTFAGDRHTLIVTSVNRIQNIVMSSEDAKETAPQMIFRTTRRDVGAKFSPDGSRIAFLSDRSGRNELWVAEVGPPGAPKLTTQPRQLTHDLPASATITFSWAPAGGSLLVGLHSTPGTMAVVDVGSGNWSPLKIKGLERSLLYCPIWSSDGRWIYASASGEQNGVFRIDPGGRLAPEHLVEGHTYDLQVDGDHSLYFDSWTQNGISRIALQAVAGGGKPRVEPIPELATVLASRKWTIEAGGLYYLDFHDQERRLRRFDLATHAVTAVTGRLQNVAFAAPTLTVLPRRHLFLYSQWDENTGSQIVELRPN
jgi:Tol biopolymer transport system component